MHGFTELTSQEAQRIEGGFGSSIGSRLWAAKILVIGYLSLACSRLCRRSPA